MIYYKTQATNHHFFVLFVLFLFILSFFLSFFHYFWGLLSLNFSFSSVLSMILFFIQFFFFFVILFFFIPHIPPSFLSFFQLISFVALFLSLVFFPSLQTRICLSIYQWSQILYNIIGMLVVDKIFSLVSTHQRPILVFVNPWYTNTKQNGRKDEISLFTHTQTFNCLYA